MSETEFLCVRCARHRRTCCQTSEVYVTPGDVRRIADHTGATGFHAFRVPADPAYADQDDDPAFRDRVFRSDGSRRVLERLEDGACAFLGPGGCRLPLDVRPLVCRLYPFDYDASGLRDALAPGCPLELLPPGGGLIAALGMDRDAARAWREELYRELVEEPLTPREPR